MFIREYYGKISKYNNEEILEWKTILNEEPYISGTSLSISVTNWSTNIYSRRWNERIDECMLDRFYFLLTYSDERQERKLNKYLS